MFVAGSSIHVSLLLVFLRPPTAVWEPLLFLSRRKEEFRRVSNGIEPPTLENADRNSAYGSRPIAVYMSTHVDAWLVLGKALCLLDVSKLSTISIMYRTLAIRRRSSQ